METAGLVALAIFMVGVVFYSGRLTTRVEHLETWRSEVREEFQSLHGHLLRLEHLITGEKR